MAYPVVTDKCLDSDHQDCPSWDKVDEFGLLKDRGHDLVCGGAFCICPCHGVVDPFDSWYIEVRERDQKTHDDKSL